MIWGVDPRAGTRHRGVVRRGERRGSLEQRGFEIKLSPSPHRLTGGWRGKRVGRHLAHFLNIGVDAGVSILLPPSSSRGLVIAHRRTDMASPEMISVVWQIIHKSWPYHWLEGTAIVPLPPDVWISKRVDVPWWISILGKCSSNGELTNLWVRSVLVLLTLFYLY